MAGVGALLFMLVADDYLPVGFAFGTVLTCFASAFIFWGSGVDGVKAHTLETHLAQYDVTLADTQTNIVSEDELREGQDVETAAGAVVEFKRVDGVDSFWLDDQKVDVKSYQPLSAEVLSAEVAEKTVLGDPVVQMVSENLTPACAVESGGILVTGTVDGVSVVATVIVDDQGHVLNVVSNTTDVSLMR